MFGADTALILDALQMGAVVAAAAAGAVYLALRKPWQSKSLSEPAKERPKTDLEERVRVLERITTDRSHDLAEEIEALRDGETKTKLKEQPQ
jgi:nicotinic acid mononucleotide adenylyltransferase